MEALRQRGIRALALVTGEREHIATIIAEQLGCERLVAQAMPQEKATLVRRLQKEGYKVAMVGRGAADVPALIAADVAVAVEGASDAARGLAHFVYHHGGLWQVPLSLDLSRKAIQLIQEDWNMVVVCNTLALGLTAVGLLDPFGASIVNDGSTRLTTANSLRPLLGMGGGRRSS